MAITSRPRMTLHRHKSSNHPRSQTHEAPSSFTAVDLPRALQGQRGLPARVGLYDVHAIIALILQKYPLARCSICHDHRS